MRYADFKKLGMFTGSGAIEAIVVQRAKQSGMHWNVDGAADIIALRCQLASGRWDELWPARTAQPTGLRSAVRQTPRLRRQARQPRARSSPTRLSCTP